MKTNVNYLKQDFYMNNDKNIVHCVLTFSMPMSKLNAFYAVAGGSLDYLTVFNKIANKYSGKWNDDNEFEFTVHGTAKCSPDDNFSEDTGRRIALTRAQKNAFRIAENVYCEMVNKLTSNFNELRQLAINSRSCVLKCQNHIENLAN